MRSSSSDEPIIGNMELLKNFNTEQAEAEKRGLKSLRTSLEQFRTEPESDILLRESRQPQSTRVQQPRKQEP
jgi:hypothetical protein